MTSSVMALLHSAGLPRGPLLSRREAMSARVRNLHALSTLGAGRRQAAKAGAVPSLTCCGTPASRRTNATTPPP